MTIFISDIFEGLCGDVLNYIDFSEEDCRLLIRGICPLYIIDTHSRRHGIHTRGRYCDLCLTLSRIRERCCDLDEWSDVIFIRLDGEFDRRSGDIDRICAVRYRDRLLECVASDVIDGDFFHMVILYGFCPKIKGGFSLDAEFSVDSDETWNHEPISHEEGCPVEESIYADHDEEICDPPIEPCPAVVIVHIMRPTRFETESLCERLSLVVVIFHEIRDLIEELVEVFDFLSASVDDFEIIECEIYFEFHILHRRERK